MGQTGRQTWDGRGGQDRTEDDKNGWKRRGRGGGRRLGHIMLSGNNEAAQGNCFTRWLYHVFSAGEHGRLPWKQCTRGHRFLLGGFAGHQLQLLTSVAHISGPWCRIRPNKAQMKMTRALALDRDLFDWMIQSIMLFIGRAAAHFRSEAQVRMIIFTLTWNHMKAREREEARTQVRCGIWMFLCFGFIALHKLA